MINSYICMYMFIYIFIYINIDSGRNHIYFSVTFLLWIVLLIIPFFDFIFVANEPSIFSECLTKVIKGNYKIFSLIFVFLCVLVNIMILISLRKPRRFFINIINWFCFQIKKSLNFIFSSVSIYPTGSNSLMGDLRATSAAE